jgi:CBS domain-containing protein
MLTIRDIMTRDVVTVSPESTIREAMEILSTNHLSGAPVVSGKRVVGVLSMSDIVSFIVSAPEPDASDSGETMAEAWEEPERDPDDEDIQSALAEDGLDEWIQSSDGLVDDSSLDGKTLLDQHTVEEAMTQEVVCLAPESSVKAAANLMRRHGIHRVIVMQGRHLEGIVSALDIARTVGEKGLAGQTGVKLDPKCADPSPWIDV